MLNRLVALLSCIAGVGISFSTNTNKGHNVFYPPGQGALPITSIAAPFLPRIEKVPTVSGWRHCADPVQLSRARRRRRAPYSWHLCQSGTVAAQCPGLTAFLKPSGWSFLRMSLPCFSRVSSSLSFLDKCTTM